jgi:hypothetical protein
MCQGTKLDPHAGPPGELWVTRTGEHLTETRPPSYGQHLPAPVYAPDPPAMAQQAGRDAMLNQMEYRHAMDVAANEAAQRKANAAALAEESEAIRVRKQATERMGQRPPGEGGEILKGLGG